MRRASVPSIVVCLCAIFAIAARSPAQISASQIEQKPSYAGLYDQKLMPPTEEQLRARTKAVRIRLSITGFRRMLDALTLSDAQEQQIITWFIEYDDAVRATEKKALDEIVPNFHAEVAADYADRPYTLDQQLAAGRKRREASTRAEAEGSILLNEFFNRSEAILSESQSDQWSRAVYAWRRSVMLNPIKRDGFGRDLGAHIDLLKIAGKLAEAEPALRPFLDRNCEDVFDEAVAAVRGQCMQVLDSFEVELDRVIQVAYRQGWDEQYKSIKALTQNDEDAFQKCRRRILDDWLRVYDLNRTAAETLALLIQEAAGQETADTWRACYYAAYYPKLYAERVPDLLHRWLHEEAKLTAEQLEFVDAAFDQFLEQRRQLRAETRRLLIDLIKELNMYGGELVLLDVGGDMPPKKAAMIERRWELDDRTAERFRSVLNEQQQEAFDAAHRKFRLQIKLDTGI